MSELCDVFERRLDEAAPGRVPERGPEPHSRLADHLAGCPVCRGRLEAHRALAAALGNRPLPALPPGFETRVRRRIAAEEGAAGRAGRGLRLLLPVYWATAGVAAAAVLRGTGAVEAVTSVGTPGLAALAATAAITAAGLLLPAAALLRSRPDPLPRRLPTGPIR